MAAPLKSQNEAPVELPVLPLRQLVLFPGTVLPVEVGRKSSLRLLDTVSKARPPRLLVVTQRDAQVEEPSARDLHPLGVEAEVVKLVRLGPDRVTAVLQGIQRRRYAVVGTDPYLIAKVYAGAEVEVAEGELLQATGAVRELAKTLSNLSPEISKNLMPALEQARQPGRLSDVVAAHLDMPLSERLAILHQLDVPARLSQVHVQLQRNIEAVQVKERIDKQVREEMSRQQREAVLRQQMKAIQEELGEGGGDDDLDELAERISKAGMSEEAEKAARRQMSRLREMPPAAAEYTVQRTYVEWLCDLPWAKRTEDRVVLEEARGVLEADHYGLAKVKKRVLEYLAVRKLAPNKKGPILCLAGPPGVGKTSLGRSIAKSLHREFVRMSLGGVHDEAEIRGHRRTYIGALPGRIIQAMKRAGSKNPVLLMDEIDKLGSDHRGDPSSALLEVLDPEQNNSFSDHYLEVPFDLSEVIFIATANSLDTIPAPLLDRMELIELPGYTHAEKREIARRHLLPKQLTEHGLTEAQMRLTDSGLAELIEHYTREAGVRNLERELANVIRGVAMKVASGEAKPDETIVIEAKDMGEYLGPAKHILDIAEQTMHQGVATGLVWTPVGGDILFIEATSMSGKGTLSMTGKLGSVMKESGQTAMSWVRAHTAELGLLPEFFDTMDLHLHVPQGGVSKDGPSAGGAIVAAMVSLLTGNKVRSDVAMTGEITLRGAVLPIGGVKEKVLAAHRAGIKRVVMPERNRKDLVDVPEEVRAELEFFLVKNVESVLDHVLERPWRPRPAAGATDGAPEGDVVPLPPAGVPEASPARC